ncbi:MAG TPA: STAS domain-containing protein [Spirochaetota bacterium]|nr:STAS domain-containing protein [Spirochaetota bacterium]HPF05663.1 STAS domain-containing protein [Spirochaetota bacterium]HPJ42248.1 STAS domain-containing protein [Spirochaetota bacterium]HPR36745.1 STAS domain-containing protein [Spirochaetota bacterium]HRX47050.1 STAS domain-containing protein [Spirochaetota bacterium]
MNPFHLTWEIEKDIPVIYLEGDITSESDNILKDAYNDIKKKSKSRIFIFDFTKSNYINSSGISSFIKIIHLHKESNGDFVFTGLSDHLLKVMDIVGLTEYISISETIESAIKKIHTTH